ncbi:transcriptional regulator [Candidatus Roizmanbacteria bacterium CG_4_10_14_3_um_filter_39_13]|uniref:Transcriptional regulator n=1 Tax=Candidatus Roizmanbacteria bacterium CG_4_10_14_3_um_filter_39_13 TaxID=1974831 RepID=A0A2M7LLJ7_9BACT|nr:MAG: transcriptional regulator [Candidatus Roizmanbacteria bacterium CG_4_10_14_3_um_filter_39_13]
MVEVYKPKNEKERLLIKAFASIKSADEAAALLRDLLTPAEIEEFANRLTIAKLLTKGLSYLEIAKQVGTSTTTVTRVAHWLYNGCGGYSSVLKKILKA